MSLIEAYLDVENVHQPAGTAVNGHLKDFSAVDPQQEHATIASTQKRTGTRL